MSIFSQNFSFGTTLNVGAQSVSGSTSNFVVKSDQIKIYSIEIFLNERYQASNLPSNEIFYLEFRTAINNKNTSTIIPGISLSSNVSYSVVYIYKNVFSVNSINQTLQSGDTIQFILIFYSLAPTTATIVAGAVWNINYEFIK